MRDTARRSKTLDGWPVTVHSERRTEQEWLDLEGVAKVQVTSEDPSFLLESALVSGKGPGWRAAQRGKQIIRIIFDKPTRLRRIRLEFSETEIARTQEFTLQWSAEPAGPLREIVRQQWNFSPQGSTSENRSISFTHGLLFSSDSVSVGIQVQFLARAIHYFFHQSTMRP